MAQPLVAAWHFDGKIIMSGGNMDAYFAIIIGASTHDSPGILDEGIFNISGGTVITSALSIGAGTQSAVGTVTMTGGTMNLLVREQPDEDPVPDSDGDNGFGRSFIRFAHGAESAGYLNLHGGTLNIDQA